MTRPVAAREAIGQETVARPKAESPVAGRGMPGARAPGTGAPSTGAPSTGIRGTGSVARRIAGVDEAGRGPLAGPVVAAAVILRPGRPIVGVADSKTLTAAERERLEVVIRRRAVCFGVGWADPAEIDSLNILHATFLAMRRAVLSMTCRPDLLLVDGNRLPRLTGLGAPVQARAIVGGDASQAAIGAASILAKTARDRYMCGMHERYPHYEFATHKGYATPLHRRLLAEHGPCPLHRRSFAPVYASLEGETWEPEIDWEDGLPEADVSLQSFTVAMDPS